MTHAFNFRGHDLHRPECVLCTESGDVFASDWRGGITQLRADGSQRFIAANLPPPLLQPNGIALRSDSTFLLADLSDARAGVWAMTPDGTTTPFLLEVGGRPLPPVNFVCVDERERTWITVSTRKQPRSEDYRPSAASGFIVLVDAGGARVAADGLGYTNECCLSADGAFLYVNETFARRLARFRVHADGTLSDKAVVATFGAGMYPDGLAIAEDGSLWVTNIVSNRVVRVYPDGMQEVIIEDADADHLAWTEAAFQAGTMGRPHLDTVRSRILQNISSLAFGGSDRRTAHLGCLLGDQIATFPVPVAGVELPHWKVRV